MLSGGKARYEYSEEATIMRNTVINENGETVVVINAPNLNPLTREQIDMIEAATQREYEYDEDCPPMDEDMLMQMDRDTEHQTKRIRPAVIG